MDKVLLVHSFYFFLHLIFCQNKNITDILWYIFVVESWENSTVENSEHSSIHCHILPRGLGMLHWSFYIYTSSIFLHLYYIYTSTCMLQKHTMVANDSPPNSQSMNSKFAAQDDLKNRREKNVSQSQKKHAAVVSS